MNGVQTRLKCKPNVKRCKRFVFAAHSPLLHPNTLKTKAIIHFQTDHILTRFVFPPLQSQVEQVKNQYRLEKRNWWNYFRLNGNYSYGRYNIIGNASDEFTPMYQTTMSSAQHNFNVGASVGVSLGDLFNRPLKLKDYRYQIEQLQYVQEDVMEERRLKVLEAYNAVTEQLATIKAKAETAALYNAQMKISENNFIQGAIDIIALSLERARRTGAVTTYEQSRVALHNSIVLLEMLTNVKVITDK